MASSGAGTGAIHGAEAAVLANRDGAVLTLAGERNGLIVSLDFERAGVDVR